MMLNRYAVAAIALAAVAGNAQAQRGGAAAVSSPISWGMAVGAAIPTSDLSNAAGTGFRLQGQMNYELPGQPVNFRAELAFDKFGDKSLPGSVTASSSAFSGAANVVFPFAVSEQMKPYLIGGLGLYHQAASVNVPGSTSSASQNNFGLNGGVGTEFALSGMNAFVEARLHMVFSGTVDSNGNKTSANYFPIAFGINF